jgi:probable F420-dependent oxidoreductase
VNVQLSGIGIWNAGLLSRDPAEIADAAGELDDLGYTSLWIPSFGPGTLGGAERLLAATPRVVVATGILNIWANPADETAAEQQRLRATYDDRFLLGLGVSHARIVDSLGDDVRYERPLRRMDRFLDELDAAGIDVGSRVLAALGPKMLVLARTRAGGAHPYNVTPEHTELARAALGPAKLLVPEQAVVLTTDVEEGRRAGRAFLEHYLEAPNYANNLRRLGFGDDDLGDGGSDRLVDALIAWGDVDEVTARVKAHLDAGADSVCVQVVSDTAYGGMSELHRDTWRELAPALTSLSS